MPTEVLRAVRAVRLVRSLEPLSATLFDLGEVRRVRTRPMNDESQREDDDQNDHRHPGDHVGLSRESVAENRAHKEPAEERHNTEHEELARTLLQVIAIEPNAGQSDHE